MSGVTGGGRRFGPSLGGVREAPQLRQEDVFIGDGLKSGPVRRMSLEELTDEETWYSHHNVPELYRGLSVGEGIQRMPVSDVSVERVLNALDPDESLRNEGQISPALVAWLAVPVEFEERPLIGFVRASVKLVDIERLAELHAGLGAKLKEMQGERKPPRTAVYVQSLAEPFRTNGKPPVDKDGAGGNGTSKQENPFRRGFTTLEFLERFGGHRMYGAVNGLWKPGRFPFEAHNYL